MLMKRSAPYPTFRRWLNDETNGRHPIEAESVDRLTNPRSVYGNDFDGTADLGQVIGSQYGGTGNGFTKLTGPVAAERTFTLPDENANVLTDAATVTIAQGGTNSNTPLNGDRVMVSTTGGVVAEAGAMEDGQLLIGSGATTPVIANITGGDGIQVTNSTGSITIAVTPRYWHVTRETQTTTILATHEDLDGMQIVTGSIGDYIVHFSGSFEADANNEEIEVAIYIYGQVNPASVARLQVQAGTRHQVGTIAVIPGLGSGNPVFVRWAVTGGATASCYERTMLLHKISD
jgi:hypothetical protein